MDSPQYDQRRNIGAIILIGIGVLFLLGQFFNVDIGDLFDFSWPFFIIIPGVVMLGFAFFGGKAAAPMVFPGAIVTTTGLILLFQWTMDYFESWSYLWTLYPVAVGGSLIFMSYRTGDASMRQKGMRTATVGLVMFIIFGAFFEMIYRGGGELIQYIVPLLLIGGGAWLLFGNRRGEAKLKNEDKPKNDPHNEPSLQQQIDEALGRDVEDEPTEII